MDDLRFKQKGERSNKCDDEITKYISTYFLPEIWTVNRKATINPPYLFLQACYYSFLLRSVAFVTYKKHTILGTLSQHICIKVLHDVQEYVSFDWCHSQVVWTPWQRSPLKLGGDVPPNLARHVYTLALLQYVA